MLFSTIFALLAGPAMVLATLDKAKSNTKGKYPSSVGCRAGKVSRSIQAAECAYNTRLATKQTFAVFKTDPKFDKVPGAPYGTCTAYSCAAPTDSDMTISPGSWTFFWTGHGESKGEGTDCIKDPNTGRCGCEESSKGTFTVDKTDCV